MSSTPKAKNKADDTMQRMDEALKAALKMPPGKHKDEPKRRKEKKPSK